MAYGAKIEAGRQHADDFVGEIVQADRPPDDVPIASKKALPEAIGQDDNVIVARHAILRDKRAAEQRLHLENVE